MISRFKPEPAILALSANEKTCNQMHLSFGCFPARVKRYKTINEAVSLVRQSCLAEKIARKGDRMVIACGVPSNKRSDHQHDLGGNRLIRAGCALTLIFYTIR